ncbi:hypothetical protein JTB14_016083 [Gonioctena quinquepunctata]|nr:hypothetical protein JTB14_016083 [Gonioctena quinquepunctata]
MIGSLFIFIRHPNNYFSTLLDTFDRYPGLFKFWFGVRLWYFVSEPKYFQIILPACLAKERVYETASTMIGEGLLVASYEKWKKTRKLVAMSFQQEILDRFVKIFSRKNKIMLEQLKKYSGKGEFDVYPTISRCTLDTICAAIMGVEVNSQTTEAEFPNWVDRVLDIMLLKCIFADGYLLTLFNLLPLGRECAEIVKKMDDFTEKIVKRRKISLEQKMRKRRIAPEEDSDEDSMKKNIR